jgi:hypothetical protein
MDIKQQTILTKLVRQHYLLTIQRSASPLGYKTELLLDRATQAQGEGVNIYITLLVEQIT